MKLQASSFWVLPLIASLVAIGPLSTDMYLPAQPAIKEDLNASIDQIQLTLSIFLVGTSLAIPFWGPLADRFGRRPIMYIGMSIFVVSSIACAMATTIEALITARLFQSIGASVGPILGRTMVRDIYGATDSAKAFGHLASIMALAPAVAPILGGFLVTHLDWRSVFYALMITAMVSVALYTIFLGETLSPDLRQSIKIPNIWRNYKTLARDRVFTSYASIMSLIFSGLFAFISVASFIIIEFLGLSPQEFGFCFLGMVVGFISGASTGAKFTEKVAPTKIILKGIFIAGAASTLGLVLALMQSYHPISVVFPIALYAFGAGLVLPQCNAASLRNYPQIAGTASSLSGIIQNVIGALAGVGVVWIHRDDPSILMAYLLVVSCLAAICFFFALPKQERLEH